MKVDVKKLIILSIPYVIVFYMVDKVAWLYLSLTDVFSDNGAKGTSFERPEFNRMMDMIKAGKINAVVCKDAYGIIGLNSKDSTDKGFLKLSPILFSLQKRLKVDLRRKHAQNEDLSAKRGVACNGGSTVSDVVPSHLLQRQSAEHTPDVDLHRSTVRYSKDVSLACAA